MSDFRFGDEDPNPPPGYPEGARYDYRQAGEIATIETVQASSLLDIQEKIFLSRWVERCDKPISMDMRAKVASGLREYLNNWQADWSWWNNR